MSPGPLHPAVRPRRLFVSGGSCLSEEAERLWVALGRRLARERGLVVITGGLRVRRDREDCNPADWAVVRGMKQELGGRSEALDTCCETVLPDESKDWGELVRFHEGRVVRLRNRTSQSRRFSMVSSADVVCSVEGEAGTRGVLDMALAVEKPILPLPFGGGASADRWKEHRAAIQEWFGISDEQASELEAVDIRALSSGEIAALADRICEWLLNGFTRNCFVMMPFGDEDADRVYDEAIRPALAEHGLRAVRTDRLGLTGNVVDCIRQAISSCFLAIADTTGDKANVMYELGMAHADQKPVVLLRRVDDSGRLELPFDLQTEQCIPYTDDDMVALRAVLVRTLSVLLGKTTSLDEA